MMCMCRFLAQDPTSLHFSSDPLIRWSNYGARILWGEVERSVTTYLLAIFTFLGWDPEVVLSAN